MLVVTRSVQVMLLLNGRSSQYFPPQLWVAILHPKFWPLSTELNITLIIGMLDQLVFMHETQQQIDGQCSHGLEIYIKELENCRSKRSGPCCVPI